MRRKRALALLCTFAMTVGLLAGCGSDKAKSPDEVKADDMSEHVEITIGGLNLGDSDETQWPTETVKKIEDMFNCSITFKAYDQESLNLDLSGGNTCDIVQINEDNIEGVLKGKHAVNLEDYKDIASNIFCDNMAFRNNVMKTFKSDDTNGQYFVTPQVTLENAEPNFGATLGFGYVVRWDLYKAIGCPAITNDDEYVDALVKMKEIYPETEDGDPVYAMAAYNDSNLHAYFHKGCITEGFVNMEGGLYVQDVETNELVSDIYDVDEDKVTPFWSGVEFYNKLYRAGLLDPDNFITKGEDLQEKYTKGQYLGGSNNWYFATYNNNQRTADPETLKEYVILPSYMGWANEMNLAGWSGKYYFVSSHSPNVQRAVMVLDYLQSEDGSRETDSGLEGRWEVAEDGSVALTEETKTIKIDGTRTDELKMSGIADNNMYNCIGYDDRNILSDGGLTNLFYDESIYGETLTFAQKDMCTTLNINLPSDLLKSGIEAGTNIDLSNAQSVIRMVIEAAPKDINRIDSNVEEITINAIPSLVMAETDEDFAAAKEALLNDLKAADVETSITWWKEAWETARTALDNME